MGETVTTSREGTWWYHPTLGAGVLSLTPAGHLTLTFANGGTATYRDQRAFNEAGLKPNPRAQS